MNQERLIHFSFKKRIITSHCFSICLPIHLYQCWYDGENDLVDGLIHDYYDGELDEEELVEEFGRCLFPEASGVWSSELMSILADIIEHPQD